MTYAQDLAKVGLHPDNPDGMFSSLQSFLKNPKAFKDADKNWRSTRDNLAAWEEPKGQYTLIWPFHGGKWLDNAPKNDTQVRAVFKIPGNISTGAFLAQAYKFPPGKPYHFKIEYWEAPKNDFDNAWNSVKQGVGTVAGIADTLKIPGANFTASLLTGQDPITGLKKDLQNFTDSAAIAKGVVSGDMGPLKGAINSGAAKFGVSLPPQFLDAAVSAAKSGDIKGSAVAAMGPGYTNAWKVATNDGKLFDAALPPPPGMSYAPGAVPAQSTSLNSHPAVAAAIKTPLAQALKAQPLTSDLHPEVKAAVIAATGIDPKLLNAKKKPWWAYGAGAGAAAGLAVGGPVGAAVGAAIGGLGAHVTLGNK